MSYYRIKSEKDLNNTLLGIRFVHSISQEHIPQALVEKLSAIGYVLEIIPELPCKRCIEYEKEINELKTQLRIIKQKSKKSEENVDGK